MLKTHNTIKHSQSNAIQLLQFHSDLENSNRAVLFFRSLCSSASVHTFLTQLCLLERTMQKSCFEISGLIRGGAFLISGEPTSSRVVVFLSCPLTKKSLYTRCVLVRPKVDKYTQAAVHSTGVNVRGASGSLHTITQTHANEGAQAAKSGEAKILLTFSSQNKAQPATCALHSEHLR